MNRIFNTLFSAMRAKIMPIIAKLRLWTSPTWWKSKGIATLRQFFSRLFDVKPKHKKDYYTVFRWMISKKLAFAIVVALAVVGIFGIIALSPASAGDGSKSDVAIRTYRYNAIPLKFYDGTVQILARDKYVAYVGNVSGGEVTGNGTLYNRDGALVYEGQFAHNMYNGSGRLYWPDGGLRYDGQFTDNLYNGQGSYYRQNGVVEYIGQYAMGLKNGAGTLYNGGGNAIFTGSFLLNELVYGEFVGKSTTDAATMYTGAETVYTTGSEYCVEMSEIGAVYAVADGTASLEEEWTISGVYVLSDVLPLGSTRLETINQLTAALGTPIYLGNTWVNLSEAVALNMLLGGEAGASGTMLPPVDIQSSSTFDEVREVSRYDTDYELYIYVYEQGGLLYTFYCDGSATPGFLMYSIELA